VLSTVAKNLYRRILGSFSQCFNQAINGYKDHRSSEKFTLTETLFFVVLKSPLSLVVEHFKVEEKF